MIYAEPCFTFLHRGSALACQYFIICIVEIIKAPVVAQSPVVRWLCMAERGGCSVSRDIELSRDVEGKQLFLAQTGKAWWSIIAAVLLRKNNNN